MGLTLNKLNKFRASRRAPANIASINIPLLKGLAAAPSLFSTPAALSSACAQVAEDERALEWSRISHLEDPPAPGGPPFHAGLGLIRTN